MAAKTFTKPSKSRATCFFMTWTYLLRTSVLDMARAYGFGQRTDFELVSPRQEEQGIAAGVPRE